MAGRYQTLAHWRGGAALWVMFFHSFETWLQGGPERLPGWARTALGAGWQGVSVFFVISGYCIAERVAADWSKGVGPGRFLADRVLRIYPVFWCALAFTTALDFAALPFNRGTLSASATSSGILPASFAEGLTNGLLVEMWFNHHPWLMVSWSLDYEVGFYVIAAAALALMLWRGAVWPAAVVAAVSVAAGITDPSLPVLSLVPHFTLGVLVWLLLHRMPGPAFTRSLAALGLFGTVVWFAGSVPGNRASLDCAAVTACTLVLLHPLDGRLAAFRPLHWLGWAGTISYSLYLVHVPIVSKTRNLGFAIFSPSGPGAGWVPLAACVAALAFAAVFYRVVESPLERLRRRILNPSPPQA